MDKYFWTAFIGTTLFIFSLITLKELNYLSGFNTFTVISLYEEMHMIKFVIFLGVTFGYLQLKKKEA